MTRTAPKPTIRWPQQLLHALLFATAVFCAICLRGNPLLMYGVLIAIVPALLLSCIPLRFFPAFVRQLLQLMLGALALTWAHRQLNNASIDIIMVEIAAILGVALLLGKNQHEYSLLFFISIGFLGYGGLMPGRPYFLVGFVIALFIALVILYTGRLAIVTDVKGPDATLQKKQVPLGNSMGYRIAHGFLTVCLVLLMLRNLPQTQALKTHGLVPVSFTTEQDIIFPRLWEKWHQPIAQIIGGKEENTQLEDSSQSDYKQHDDLAEDIDQSDSNPSFDSHSGSGNAFGMGTKLVFRARTPAKLYWVVQMYDDYDGNAWKCTPAMQTGMTGPDEFIPPREVEVPQHISMELPVSNKLPYAFRFKEVDFRNKGVNNNSVIARQSLYNKFSLVLKGRHLPAPPWNYRVQSFVPNPEQGEIVRPWREPLRNNGWNYRRLPNGVISDRLRNLADEITRNAANPFEKAVMIRDYLRNNYTYDLNAPVVPPDREVVDYFLFESKTGYCQHFAQAFTVLARLVGLHSRLVTGYSPGNYNLLTNTFEVYQYHAHAWTHIFIEPFGWLTFDGVAPGNLRIENTPALLTDLIDPFGDEWNARPPELTYIPPPSANQSLKQSKTSQKSPTLAVKIYEKAAQDNNTTDPSSEELGKAAVEVTFHSVLDYLKTLWHNLTTNLLNAWASLRKSLDHVIQACLNMSVLEAIALAFILLVGMVAYIARKFLFHFIAQLWQLYRCRLLWFSLEHNKLTPDRRILICQAVASQLLKLSGFKRPPNVDLLEWADLIAQESADSADHYRQVALAANQVRFSNHPASPEQASMVKEATGKLCQLLSPFLSQTMAQAK